MRRIISLCLITLFLSSCASSRRLGRFYNAKSLESEKKAERTNMFPLYYESGDASSVLWPLLDKDDHGFAFRPFYNQEDNEYAVLFPLSAWNPVVGDGWIGPYMWDQDSSILFPIFYKSEDKFQLLTYYDLGETEGLFPLYHLNEYGGWAGGVYGWDKTDESITHKALLGLLAYWKDENNGDNSHYLFPYYSCKEGDSKFSTVLPLYFAGEEDDGSSFSTLIPLYYSSQNHKGEKSIHSLLGGYSKIGNDVDMNITPLWWSGSNDKGSYQTFLPLYYNSEYGASEKFYLFPYFKFKDVSGEGQVLFPLFVGRETNNSSWFLTPLSWKYKSKTEDDFHIFPLFSSNKNFDKEGDLKDSSWGFPWLIPLASNKTTKDGFETSSLFGAIYHNQKTENEKKGSVLGFLAGWESDEESSRFRIPSLFNMTGIVDIAETEDTSKVNFLLYSHEKSPEVTRRDIFPFMTWDSGKNESGFSFLWRVFETHERNGKKGGHIFFIPWGA